MAASADRSGGRRTPRGQGYDRELEGLYAALAAPTVGHPDRAADLGELHRLINRYPEEARKLLAERERLMRGE